MGNKYQSMTMTNASNVMSLRKQKKVNKVNSMNHKLSTHVYDAHQRFMNESLLTKNHFKIFLMVLQTI